MKKIFLATLILGLSFNLFAAEPVTVNEKVLSSFNKTFVNVQEIIWSETADYYMVNFKQNDMVIRATYDKQGSMVSSLRYYKEDQLPILILSKVKNRFTDKCIYAVTEETNENGVHYHITLQDEKHWVMIISDSYGNITIDKKYDKA
jgi:hypothetical protein